MYFYKNTFKIQVQWGTVDLNVSFGGDDLLYSHGQPNISVDKKKINSVATTVDVNNKRWTKWNSPLNES